MAKRSGKLDPFHLDRFVDAQAPVFERVRAELAAGEKRSHWMWFIFPQIRGLGSSFMAQRFAIANLDEAAAYLRHPLLGSRLRNCTALVNAVQNRSVGAIFGSPDDLKFRSSMTLFAEAAKRHGLPADAFREALTRFFEAAPDSATMDLLPGMNMPDAERTEQQAQPATRACIRVGTAGWSIPREQASNFDASGSGLQRYSEMLQCAEVNSTFYRSHRASTYARWVASVPDDFLFSVKVSKEITHGCALAPAPVRVRSFFKEIGQLAPKLGPVLLQLPPRQSFVEATARTFLGMLREMHPEGPMVLEPRHVSWSSPEAQALLREYRIARVAADPPLGPAATQPGGTHSPVYYRLHGSPRTYSSSYSVEQLQSLAADLLAHPGECDAWCIFDNTASGAAMQNALTLIQLLGPKPAM